VAGLSSSAWGVECAEFPFFPLLTDFLPYMHTRVCLSIHWLMDIYAVSGLGLLWIRLIWALMCNSLDGCEFSFL
jgi:hypothetical protein